MVKVLKIILFILLYVNNIQGQEFVVLDLKAVPYSYFGSYMAVSTRTHPDIQNKPGLFIHDVSGKNMWKWNGVFRIEPVANGKPVNYTIQAYSSGITLTTSNGKCRICFENASSLRFKCNHMDVRISCLQKEFPYIFPFSKGQWLIPDYVFTSLQGKVIKDLNEEKFPAFTFSSDSTDISEFVLENYESGWKSKPHGKTFEQCTKGTDSLLFSWISHYPSCPDKYRDALNLALYINWSCVVSPRDNMTRYGMLMSKNWMHSVWSWDNCFNAMATAIADPDLAWQQIELLLEHQHVTGALPDALTDYNNVWAFVKPPVYGFILENMIQQQKIVPQQLPYIYEHISRLTEFWFNYRDLNGNGIPEYYHGNDSGWDNATAFDIGYPVESADLCSFLICQMDFLSTLAEQLGKTTEAHSWKTRSDGLLQYMITSLWEKDHFVSKNINTGKWNEKSQSLLPFIPLILGDRLPPEYRKKIIGQLKVCGNITSWGLAIEDPASGLYTADGYWRGPVWAPTTYIIVKGLEKCGESGLAADIARRYCDLCVKNGFPENFDALTGKPLRDLAYTWTSSVYILLLNDYLLKK